MKLSRIIYYGVYVVLFITIGWVLHANFGNRNGGNYFSESTPYVLTKSLREVDISPKKKFIAQIEAINSVDIVPQVSGYITKITFQEGKFVKKGELLFVIEDDRYKANVDSAKASLIQLEAEYKRIKSLYENRYVSKSDLEVAESNLKKAKANLNLAEIDLAHTKITSPINGYIGKAFITLGNFVNSNSQSLARIVQLNPIRIVFSISDKDKLEFINNKKSSDDFVIDILLPNGNVRTVKVNELFYNNEVNTATATIPVYANVDNKDNLLTPGSYLDIYFRTNKEKKVLVIPQVALSEDLNGTYAMVVKDDSTVQKKYIQLENVVDDGQVVISGLDADDKFIVQGLQKVVDGIKVNSTYLKD